MELEEYDTERLLNELQYRSDPVKYDAKRKQRALDALRHIAEHLGFVMFVSKE
jgi:hypothetical protein